MTIKFKCEKCGARFQVDDSKAGKKAKCPCGNVFEVPASSAEYFIHKPTPTPTQNARYQRINAQLQRERGMPIYAGPMWTYADEEVVLRDPRETARRVFVLWAVSIRGEGVSREELWNEFIDYDTVWPYASPAEQDFLADPAPDPDLAGNLVWRLESMWVLMWALGHIPQLNWPEGMCDTKRLIGLVAPVRNDPSFVMQAKMRAKNEILDQQELITRIHWAMRDAYLNQRQIPANLNWKQPSKWIPAAPNVVGRLVEERHHVLNWLVGFGNAEWDDVDTPT